MTIEEELVGQIKLDTRQFARITANARSLHRRWIRRSKDQLEGARNLAGINYRKALHEADTVHGRAVEQARAQAAYIYQRSGLALAEWDDPRWRAWQPPITVTAVQESVRVGQLIEAAPAGREVALPAVAWLLSENHLIIKAVGPAAKKTAAGALQSVLFRLLADTPPGQLRLTVLDPANLLSEAKVFASLADDDPGLVTGGVWREPAEVEAVLAYLVGNVATGPPTDSRVTGAIQRVVTVLDFSSGFSQEAARQLRALVQLRGASGVCLVMLLDPSDPMTDAFDLVELEQAATVIRWDGERFMWEVDELQPCRLVLDSPPDDALAKALVAGTGAGAVQTLPQEFDLAQTLLPARGWWQTGIAQGIFAPVGARCGGEMAMLSLGHKPTSHLLVTGGLDMGRSDLLRAILMNCAVTYDPEHLRLYLLGLPGGLDLRRYAAHWLPHAQVVAADCAREYALSVLEHLDALPITALQAADTADSDTRGGHSARNVAHLLLIDEFAQLLTGDDEIAVRATELLSHLIEGGHQKGVHVILATSAGELPDAFRPAVGRFGACMAFTAGQPNVKGGSAADGKLAPGMAMYNDAAGKPWGDQLVRVPTVPEADETKLLAQLRARGEARSAPFPPQAFSDPEALAEVTRCWPLYRLLMAGDVPGAATKDANTSIAAETTTSAWLGERPLLGQAAAATFWPRDGRHLLVVSDNELAATGMLAATILSLGIHAQRESSRLAEAENARSLSVVDFSAGKLPVLGRLGGVLGPLLEVVAGRELPALLARIAQLVDRRLDSQYPSASPDAPILPDSSPVFMVLAGLHHALAAPKSYDGDVAERFASAERLAKIVQLGPSVGVHVIAWCDALSSFNAVLGAAMLSEFGMRAVTRLSEEDSTALLDSPAASLLKINEALLWDRRLGVLQSFRPYYPPEDAWLGRVRESMRGRTAAKRAI